MPLFPFVPQSITLPVSSQPAAITTHESKGVPVPPSEDLLKRTLAEAERLAALAPETELNRAKSLLAVASAYAAADRPGDAKRLYSGAVASAARMRGNDVLSVFRDIARGQVLVRDDTQAAQTAALSRDKEIAQEIKFLIARRDAPEGSPLRARREEDAFRAWAGGASGFEDVVKAQREEMRKALTDVLDDPKRDPSLRLNALSQSFLWEPESAAARTARYLPALSADVRNIQDPAQRARSLATLTGIYYQIGDRPAAQAAFTDSTESAALIPDAEDRFRQMQSLLSLLVPSPLTPENGARRESSLPPFVVSKELQERVSAAALAALESCRASRPGETPSDAVQRLVNAANSGMTPTAAPYTPVILRSLMQQAVVEAEKMPPVSRQVSLRLIGMVQARAASPDAVLKTLRLSPDRQWRVSTLLDLASVGDPDFLSPAEQSTQRARLVTAALAEARGFPTGPARYQSLVTVLRTTLTTVGLQQTLGPGESRALYREIVALVPQGIGPLPRGWNPEGDAQGQVFLLLAHLGQRLSEHQTARLLLGRASAITRKNPTDDPPGADFLLCSIARAQAFSGDFAGAKVTQSAALSYLSTQRYADEPKKNSPSGRMRAEYMVTLAVHQAGIHDFNGALATVAAHIPIRFAGERSRALSLIVQEMAGARKGKPIVPYSDYF